MSVDYLKLILTARVYDVAKKTPLQKAELLSSKLGNNILIKREDAQDVFSFKIRGAYNKIAQLSPEALNKGVIAASAGNHAQGVAFSAQRLGIPAVIVMPVSTPEVKVNAVKRFGGQVVLYGESYSDAYNHSLELQKRDSLTYIHPFDDPYVIAGQGTVGMEILSDHWGEIEAIFVPIGGGGLIAGIASYVKALKPQIKVIGVQTEDSCAMMQSIAAGERLNLKEVGLFADGTAVKQVGQETLRLVKQYVDDFVTVDTDAVCAAIKDIFQDTRSVLEPSGALALAGLKKYAEQHQLNDKTLVAVASGANINFDRLRFVAERANVGEHKEALFAVTMPERKGSFKRLCNCLGSRQITEFNYRMSDHDVAYIFVGCTINSREDIEEIVGNISNEGFKVSDLTENDVAKTHVRHMVGGRSDIAVNEILLSFEFPEKPGALMNFLNNLNPRWNISLFHYRNAGSDFGRVLTGIQVPPEDREKFEQFLVEMGYPYNIETENPVYKWFLS